MHTNTRAAGALCLIAGLLLATPICPLRAAPSLLTAASAGAALHITPQGKITQLAIDPGHPDTIYAGTDAAGIYRSANGGATWQAPGKGLPDGVAVASLRIAASNGHTVLYAATDKGVYKSSNGGATWASEGPPTGSPSSGLAIDPSTASTIYAGTGGDGIYQSRNGGATWAAIGPSQATVQVVATDPVSGATLYAGTDDGLLVRSNGAEWLRAGLGHVGVQALAISAATPSQLYVGTANGVMLSRDSGASWARAGLRDLSVTTLYADPQDAASVYAASDNGGGLFHTANSGRNWQPLVAGFSDTNVLSLAIDPTDPRVAYAGLDRGVFKSLQAGRSWASSSIYDRSVHALLQPASATGTYYAGTNGGVYASSDGGTVWTSDGLGNHTIRDLLATQDALLAATEAGVYRTSDSGHSWPATLRLPALTLHTDPIGANVVLAGTSQGLFRSANGGQRWVRLPAGFGEIDALLTTSGAIYAGGAGGVLTTHDDGATFSRSGVNGEKVVQLLAQPNAAGTALSLYARAGSGHLYRSDDLGGHWVDCSVGAAVAAALAVGGDRRLYASTANGIYRSSSRGVSWIRTDQFPGNPTAAGLQPLVLQPALGSDTTALLEGLTDQGVVVRSLQVTPTSPFAPPANGSIGRYFPDTGHFLRAPFLGWYGDHNGAAIFGSPRTEAFTENGQLVQYFQRAVLVYHPELANTPRVIELAPLGQQLLGAPTAPIPFFENTTKRRFFPQTSHSLSGEFLAYWRANGGVDIFGLPISEPLQSAGKVVQYFQNVRFEADSSAGAASFNTRLSLLGDLLLIKKGWL